MTSFVPAKFRGTGDSELLYLRGTYRVIHDPSARSQHACLFWETPTYRHTVLVDSFNEFRRGFGNLASWRLARHCFAEGMRLLRDYVLKSRPRINRGHADKHQAIWEAIEEYVPKVIVEVGSLDGLDALTLSRIFPSARVFTFEADPRNFPIVQRNVGFRKQIIPLPLAVFDFTGTGVFHGSGRASSRENPTASGSMLMPAPKFRQSFPNITFEHDFEVETTTLSDWMGRNGIGGIDIIWMDAQGSELRILKGMEDHLQGVRVIMLEVATESDYEGGGRLEEIQIYLAGFGFRQNCSWMDGDSGDALFLKS